jgi:outer membrane protein TolC
MPSPQPVAEAESKLEFDRRTQRESDDEPAAATIQPTAYAPASQLESRLAVPGDAMSAGELDVESLVADVLARHPDIRSATAAWRAATQRYPQDVSLEDPMFGFMVGPDSWGEDQFQSAYSLEVSQTIPWPGKRQLRGNMARAEANAAYFDIGEQRLRIAEATRRAFYDYFLARRQIAVLEESTDLLESFREIALRKFESAEAEQQDVLLADVELADLERQRLELVRAERVARARINTLLILPPANPLPPPPADLTIDDSLPSGEDLLAMALSRRPELASRAAQIRRERYAAALACKEFYPDLTLAAAHNAFMVEEPLRPMVGMNVNVPIYKQKRWAAVREANARAAQEQAMFDAQTVELAFQVQQSRERVEESRQTIAVFQQRLLPTAQHSVEAARASYVAGRLDFLRLIEAQRQLLTLQDRYYAVTAEYFQRQAELERIVAAPLF